jgi:hypothetical protein
MLVLYPGALLQSRAEPADEMLIKAESRTEGTSYYKRITICKLCPQKTLEKVRVQIIQILIVTCDVFPGREENEC